MGKNKTTRYDKLSEIILSHEVTKNVSMKQINFIENNYLYDL